MRCRRARMHGASAARLGRRLAAARARLDTHPGARGAPRGDAVTDPAGRPQPVPAYREADLERILARDYAADALPEIRELLRRYGTESWQREPLRVRMACLKIAGGSMAALRQAVGVACADYRDVLATAEYRHYMSARDAEAKQKAIERDWTELRSWLERS